MFFYRRARVVRMRADVTDWDTENGLRQGCLRHESSEWIHQLVSSLCSVGIAMRSLVVLLSWVSVSACIILKMVAGA